MATENSPKIAIVTEWLWSFRGNEKVLDDLLDIFPQAEVYALFGDTRSFQQTKNIKNKNINYSFLQKFPLIKKYYRYTYFLWPIAIEGFDFKEYDIVFSLSTSVAKGVITGVDTTHICYMSASMRYAWDLKENYFNKQNFSLWKRLVIPFFLNYLRVWDFSSNKRIDYLIANSNFTKDRVFKYYKQKVDAVIFPPVADPIILGSKKKSNYYYYNSALEPNKGIINLINCAIKYGFNLKVAGDGSLRNQVKKLAKRHKNIEILGWVTDEEKYRRMEECIAFIFPSIEDFGIVSLEAISVGTPVIALDYGGAKDTVIDGKTGILIKSQTPEDIYEGIKRLRKVKFEKNVIRKHFEKFRFENFKKDILSVYNKFVDTN